VRGPAHRLERLPPALRGPAWMIVACFAFAGVWGLIRAASDELHPFVIVFFRNLFGAILILPIARTAWHRGSLRRWPIHLRRAGSGIVATYATFFAVANAPLADVQAINFAAPLFATIGAALFLGERIRIRRIAALVVGFAGVLIVLRPGQVPLTPGILAAIVAAISTAFSLVTIKQLVGTDDPRLVAAFTFFLMLPLSALVLPFYWSPPDARTWALLAAIGGCAVVGQLATSYAFRAADATAVMPYDFVRFGIVIAIGWLAFDERVDATTFAGGAVILASSIYLAYREQVAARGTRVVAPIDPGT
jgi:drug/metabolite transporter (DMT)-like permease